jgi:hypothetical protein
MYWSNLAQKVLERICTGLGMGLGMTLAFRVVPSGAGGGKAAVVPRRRV